MSKQGVVNIRGKEYKTVALRVQEFREQFKDYALVTDVIQLDQEQCVIKASVLNELNRVIATGIAQEFRKASQINGTSYVENCETSAIGRALSALGLGGQEFASANEVLNAIHQQNTFLLNSHQNNKSHHLLNLFLHFLKLHRQNLHYLMMGK